jgi:hypothetical protein
VCHSPSRIIDRTSLIAEHSCDNEAKIDSDHTNCCVAEINCRLNIETMGREPKCEERVTSKIYDGLDIASDSGESIAQSGGDDTTGISASTVVAKIVVLSHQFILN